MHTYIYMTIYKPLGKHTKKHLPQIHTQKRERNPNITLMKVSKSQGRSTEDPGIQHCRQILHRLSREGSPTVVDTCHFNIYCLKFIGYITPRVNPNEHWTLGDSDMTCSFIDFYQCTLWFCTLVLGLLCGSRRLYRSSLYLLLNFAVNLKLF